MSEIVYVLGAGASKHAGAPLMNDFLDTARRLWSGGQFDQSSRKEAFEAVFDGISTLQHVHSKAQLDIHNVESVFFAFEMASTLLRYGDYNENDILTLVNSMKTVISATLEKTVQFPVIKREGREAITPPDRYRRLAQQVDELRGTRGGNRSVSILTFNYDLALDYALHWNGARINYALTGGPDTGLPLLKLHGSLNWGECQECGDIVPWAMGDCLSYFKSGIRRQLTGESPPYIDLPVAESITRLEHCDQSVEEEPFVVPPTWNKIEGHKMLQSVWQRAASELSDAETIIVIGYSLPSSDLFFRYLYALGTVGKKPLRRFWVFNPDKSNQVHERISQLLGPGAAERYQYFPIPFDNALTRVKDTFGLVTG